MKIVFVSDTMVKGGAERVIANLANYLQKNNEIYILTLYNSNVEYKLNDNIKVIPLDKEKTNIAEEGKSSIFNRIKKWKSRINKINELKKEIKPDLILSFMPLPSFISLLSNFKVKCKTIISVRNDPSVEFKSFVYKILMKWLFPKTDGIVFQTEDAKNYFSKKIRNKGTIIPNPINEDFIGEKYDGTRQKNIVSVGRLELQKNHELLINAFSNVLKKHNDYNLIIYGEGSLKEKLEEQIKNLNLSDKVHLPGKIDNVKEKIIDAGMFVLSSSYEGMPNALMEAMALGIPVVSTDCPCGGPKFLIKNNINGILVENKNQSELEDAMNKIIEDSNFGNKISKEAHKICDELNPKKINKCWENYIYKIKDGDKSDKQDN